MPVPCDASVWTIDCCEYHCLILHSIAQSWSRCCLCEIKWAVKDNCNGCTPPDRLPILDLSEHDLCILTPPNERIIKIFDEITPYLTGHSISKKLKEIYPFCIHSSDVEVITNIDWLSNLIDNNQQKNDQKVDFECIKSLTIDYIQRFLPTDPNWLDEDRFLPDLDARFDLQEIDEDYWDVLDRRTDPHSWTGVNVDGLPQLW